MKKELGKEGRITLQWFFKQQDRIAWTGCAWLRIGRRERPL
jgi:hypothetical protein